MAVSRKLTVRDKRMVGLVLAIVFIIYGLKRFYPQGILQISQALNINPDMLALKMEDVAQAGEGFVLFRVLGSVLAKGWVKTVAVWGSLIYAIDGVLQLFNVNIMERFTGNNNNNNGSPFPGN